MIHLIVNKYDTFIAPDPYPLSIKYVSFASFDNTPIEFYYNCSENVIPTITLKPEKYISNGDLQKNISHEHKTSQSFTFSKKLDIMKFSPIEFTLLIITTLILTINMAIMYYVFLLSRYID